MVLVGVTVRAVDHEDLGLLLGAESLTGSLDASAVIVGTSVATAQDDETVLVTGGLGDCSQTLLGDTEEAVGVRGGANGVDSDSQVTVGAVLVTDGEGQTRGELAVKLGLGGAGADCAQRDQVCQVLRGDGVEHLGGDGESGAGQVGVQLTGDAQTLVDVEGLVDIGVIDQSLPANCCAGLLQVGTHDHADILLQFYGKLLESAGVLKCGIGVVDRAWSDNNEQAIIALLNNLDCLIPTGTDCLNGTSGLYRQLLSVDALGNFAMSPQRAGVKRKKKYIDSRRGSHSARSRATAMGRIRGLITKDHQYRMRAHVALGHNSTIPHTTSVLIDFSSVDERHDVQETLVVISINYIEDIENF